MPSPTSFVTSDMEIAAGATVAVADPDLYPLAPGRADRPAYVYLSGSGTPRFVNHGLVTVTQGSATSGWLTGFGIAATSAMGPLALFDNAIDGRFMVDGRWVDPGGNATLGFTAGYVAPGTAIAFRNAGAFEVRAASGDAFGAWSATGALPFANSGVMTVVGAYRAVGVSAPSASAFDNIGSILVSGLSFAEGVRVTDHALATLINRGTIRATTDPFSPNASIGLFLGETQAPAAGAFTIDNRGMIAADIAILVADGRTAALIADIVRNSGSILGDVSLGFGNDLVENRGTMSGRTLLGPGSDRFDGVGGRHDGSVEGGPGADRLDGGDGADTLYGDAGDDRIFAGGGDDYIEGGWGSDRLDGGAGNDVLSYALSPTGVSVSLASGLADDGGGWDRLSGFERLVGSRFADVLTGDGAGNVLRGLDGNDRIVGGAGSDIIRGDGGNDLLSGGGGNDLFLFQAGDGPDAITDFGVGNRVQVHGYAAPQSLQQVGSGVVLTLSTADRISFADTSLAVVQAGLTFVASLLDMPVIADEAILALDEQFAIRVGSVLRLTDPLAV